MKKLAIIGNGMLGSEVVKAAKASGWQPVVYDYPEFDITDYTQLEELVKESDCIVNCSAYTNVDKAESEPEKCFAVNSDAPGKLGEFAAAEDKYVLHISTDFVFGDLTDQPQDEDSTPEPLSVYGASKLAGELKLLKSGCKCSIIRVEWSYGINGQNFISKIISLAEKHSSLKVVDDQTGAPTSTRDMANTIVAVLEKKLEGTFHFASSGYTTRFEVAKEIIDKLQLDCKLSPCSSDEFPTPAKRPKNSKFDCSKIENALGIKRPEWRDSLIKYLEEISK